MFFMFICMEFIYNYNKYHYHSIDGTNYFYSSDCDIRPSSS